MSGSNRWKILGIAALLVIFSFLAVANFVPKPDRVASSFWPNDGLRLGLDLRGASHQRIDLRGADLGGALLTDLQTESLSFAASDLTGATGLNSIAGIDEPATIGYCATTLPDGQSFTSWPFGSGWGGCDEGKRSRLVRNRR